MDGVKLILNSIKVGRFSARNWGVDIVIVFNDGVDKEITKSIVISNPEENAQNLVEEICNIVKNTSNRFDGREVFGREVKLFFGQKDAVTNVIASFLNEVQLKVESIRNRKNFEGYMNLVREVTAMRKNL